MAQTFIQKVGYRNPASAALAAVAVAADMEAAILSHPNMIRYWEGDKGFTGDTWAEQKSGGQLLKRNAAPVQTELSAYGGQKAVVINTSQDLHDGGANFLPTAGDFSLVVVGRPGPDDNAVLVGNAVGNSSVTTDQFQLVHRGMNANDGVASMTIRLGSGGVVSSDASYPRRNADGPNIYVTSHKPSSSLVGLRMNRGAVNKYQTHPNGTVTLASGSMRVGCAGVVGQPNFGQVEGGEIAAIMVLNCSILEPQYAGLLAYIERHLSAKYHLFQI